ncbi:hypothetical protein WMZ97_10700 [Lentibacillus sp. N15]|uniref:hypothetical protein n=1 Tax=Lentibacillus songyuanensis TaxID=3136161 RepID=UPI0031BAF9F0
MERNFQKRVIELDTEQGGQRQGILVQFKDLQSKRQKEQGLSRLVDDYGKALKNLDRESMIKLCEEYHGVTLSTEDLKVVDTMLEMEKRFQDIMEKSENVISNSKSEHEVHRRRFNAKSRD